MIQKRNKRPSKKDLKTGILGMSMYAPSEINKKINFEKSFRDSSTERSTKIDQIYTGDIFGEIGLLTNLSRTSTVISDENCLVLTFDKSGLNYL